VAVQAGGHGCSAPLAWLLRAPLLLAAAARKVCSGPHGPQQLPRTWMMLGWLMEVSTAISSASFIACLSCCRAYMTCAGGRAGPGPKAAGCGAALRAR
jgi:hypothetical protein